MSTVSSESDTPLDTQDNHLSSYGRHKSTNSSNNSKRKSVIDTRRAEQNRAAQRAFRQRKEIYLRELEDKVRDMEILKDRVERLELENERLKYRVWELESSSSFPNSTYSLQHPTSQPPSPSSSHQLGQSSKSDTTYNNTPTEPSSSPPSHTPCSQPTLPPPSPSPSVFRPIPVAYWEGKTSKRPLSIVQNDPRSQDPSRRRHNDDTTPTEQGRVLDDLASILRTRHRPPIHQDSQQSTEELMHT